MTTGEIPTVLPWRTATRSNEPTAARHRDDGRPTRYGPHVRRRAASLGRVLNRYLDDGTNTKEAQR